MEVGGGLIPTPMWWCGLVDIDTGEVYSAAKETDVGAPEETTLMCACACACAACAWACAACALWCTGGGASSMLIMPAVLRSTPPPAPTAARMVDVGGETRRSGEAGLSGYCAGGNGGADSSFTRSGAGEDEDEPSVLRRA